MSLTLGEKIAFVISIAIILTFGYKMLARGAQLDDIVLNPEKYGLTADDLYLHN